MDVDGKVETARIAVAGTGVMIYGMTLNEWVAVATLIYLAIQMVVLMPKALKVVHSFFRSIRGKK